MIALGRWILEYRDPEDVWHAGHCCYPTYRDAEEARDFLSRQYGYVLRIGVQWEDAP